MKKTLCVAMLLLATSAHGLVFRTITGTVKDAQGALIAAGTVKFQITGTVPADAALGIIAARTTTCTIAAGALGACSLAAPARYMVTITPAGGVPWSWERNVAEAGGVPTTLQAIYLSAISIPAVVPNAMAEGDLLTLLSSGVATSGQVPRANGSGAIAWGNAGTADVANALKSATTTVDVSAAAAPAVGQVLTATNDHAATWQVAAGGLSAPVKATDMSSAPTDLGDANVTVDLSNSHAARTTSLTLDGTVTADTATLASVTGGAGTQALTFTSFNADRGPHALAYYGSPGGDKDPWLTLGYNKGPSGRILGTDGSIHMTIEGNWLGAGEWHVEGNNVDGTSFRMLTCAHNYTTKVNTCTQNSDSYYIKDTTTGSALMSFSQSWGGLPSNAAIHWDHGTWYVDTYGSTMMFRNHALSAYVNGFGFDVYGTLGWDRFVIGKPWINSTNADWYNDAYIAGKWQTYGSDSANVYNAVKVATPTVTSVVATCPDGACATTWGYRISCLPPDKGTNTEVSAEVTALNNAALDGSHFNTITWTPPAGASNCDVFRHTGGATQGRIGQTKFSPFVDNGIAAAGAEPAVNTTGTLVVGISTTPPAAAGDACTAGRILVDASNIYVCTASGAWKRAAISAW